MKHAIRQCTARIGVLSLLLCAGCAHGSGGAADDGWARLSEQLEIMRACPARVWPGYDWRDAQVVFYDRVARDARVFPALPAGASAGAPASDRIDWQALPEFATSGNFATGPFAGRPTLFVSLEYTRQRDREYREAGIERGLSEALPFAFHEAFHAFGQQGWPRSGAERASDYPLDPRPRYLRLMLLRSMQAVLRGEGSLSAPTYWWQRYRDEYAEERASVVAVDVSEGAASYVEVVSSWLGREGCALSERELTAIGARELDDFVQYLPRKSGESYALGAAAGLLLRTGKVADWQARVAAGEPPADVLLAAVAPAPQPDDPVRQERLAAEIAAQNDLLAGQLADFIARYRAPGQLHVALPDDWRLGSFTATEPVRLVELEGTPAVYPHSTPSSQAPTAHTPSSPAPP